MTRPSFLHGIALALGIALAAGAVFAAAAPLLGAGAALRLLIPGMALVYLLCLLRRSPETTGRITALVLWLAASFAAWMLSPPIVLYVLVHAGMLWLVRSLYFHSGAFAALLDFGLTALAVSAAGWAIGRSGSVFLAAWCFFLVQAVFVAIPSWSRRQSTALQEGDDAFECARRRADAALRQLFSH